MRSLIPWWRAWRVPTEANLRFLEVYLGEARSRIEAAGPKWLEDWQALAHQLEDDEEAFGPWAAVRATGILGSQVADGRQWDGSRWLTPEQYRAVYGRPRWEVEMEQLEFETRQPVDETPFTDAFVALLRAGQWGGAVAQGFHETEHTTPAEMERVLDAERRIQLGEWPEWASDEEVEESIRSLGSSWLDEVREDAAGSDFLTAVRAAAALASRSRVRKLRGGSGDLTRGR